MNDYWKGYFDREKMAVKTCKICNYRKKIMKKIDKATLIDFFISSVDETQSPIWTGEHIEELLYNFDVISK